MDRIIVTSPIELESIIEKFIDKKLGKEEALEKTYSINQVAKLLGRSHKIGRY